MIKIGSRIDITDIYYFLTAVILFTVLRKYFILILPLWLVITLIIFNLRFTINSMILIGIALINTIISWVFNEFYPVNNIISIILIFSPILLFLSAPAYNSKGSMERFFAISAFVLFVVDLTAYYDIINALTTGDRLSDDAFVGIYSSEGLGTHTLSLVNFIYASYFYFVKRYNVALFFFMSAILSFFGAGLLTFLLAVVIYVIFVKRRIKYFISGFVIITIVIGLTSLINPKVNNYMKNNVRLFVDGFSQFDFRTEMRKAHDNIYSNVPRKITFHIGAFNRIIKDPYIIFFGTGPGTYNSRTAFLLNGEYSDIQLINENFRFRPVLAESDVFVLWNKDILVTKLHRGTRNEPWSAIIAMVIEYGALFTCLLLIISIVKIRKLIQRSWYSEFVIFTAIFLLLCLAGDNYLEYPEISFLAVLILKLSEVENKNLETIN